MICCKRGTATGVCQLAALQLNKHLGCRKQKQDEMPTVAFWDASDDTSNRGTMGYYLAAAFDQIYVQPNVLVPFTGKFVQCCFILYGISRSWAGVL